MKKSIKISISSIVIATTLMYMMPIYAISNKEMVYSKLNSTGENYKTIITTTENDETKQEDSNKELPLTSKVTYKLDGKEINPNELAGKSGRVTIKIEYENNSFKRVNINGKTEIIYTPFIVAIGTVIDNEKNENIEVSKGAKIIENGNKSLVIGVVFPGLGESLGLKDNYSDIDIPNSIEISMDSKEFEMKNILTYASPKIFTEDINWSNFDNLFAQVNELQNGIDGIENGANELGNGIVTLNDGANSLKDGAIQLNEGANLLDNGINELKSGTDILKDGASELSQGANKLSNGATEVNGGAKSLNNGIKDLGKGLKSAEDGIFSIQDGANQLVNGTTSVDEGANNLKKGLEELGENTGKLEKGMETLSGAVTNLSSNLSKINEKVKALQKELNQYSGKISELQQLIEIDEKYMNATTDSTEKAIWEKNIEAIKAELELLTKASSIGELTVGLEKITVGAKSLNDETSNLPQKAKELNSGVNQLVIGATSLADGTKQVNDGATNLYKGTNTLLHGASQLTKGVSQLSKGSDTLLQGTNTLSIGAESLNSGAKELANGTKDVSTGVTELANGSKSLKTGTKNLSEGTLTLSKGTVKLQEGSKELINGIHKFNTEGIKKISVFVNGNLKNLETRAKKIEELSKEYNKFANDDTREEIGFISIIDSIKSGNSKKEDNKEE